MRNWTSNRNQSTWDNTETRTSRRAFYKPANNQKLLSANWGVGALNYFMDRLGNMGDLKREVWKKDDISGLKSLICGQRAERNSADNSENSGSLAGRIAKTLIYGKSEKYDKDLKMAK